MAALLLLGIGVLLYAACAVAAGALLLTLPALSVFGLDLSGLVGPALASWAVITLVLAGVVVHMARDRGRRRSVGAGD